MLLLSGGSVPFLLGLPARVAQAALWVTSRGSSCILHRPEQGAFQRARWVQM